MTKSCCGAVFCSCEQETKHKEKSVEFSTLPNVAVSTPPQVTETAMTAVATDAALDVVGGLLEGIGEVIGGILSA
jgi:hypothetical protein